MHYSWNYQSDSDRPRERLIAYGAEGVSTAELLALILGTGLPGVSATALAARIIHQSGGISSLAQATPRELITAPGIGEARAARIIAAFHLGRRVLESEAAGATAVVSARHVYDRLSPRLNGIPQEIFIVLSLNSRNVVLDEIEVARGWLTGVEVHPREVFRPLIRQSAAAAIVAHNHPSGDPTPSPEDIALTERLRAVGEMVGIPILDHVIIGAGRFASVAEL